MEREMRTVACVALVASPLAICHAGSDRGRLSAQTCEHFLSPTDSVADAVDALDGAR
jgi:hypothetical protein